MPPDVSKVFFNPVSREMPYCSATSCVDTQYSAPVSSFEVTFAVLSPYDRKTTTVMPLRNRDNRDGWEIQGCRT
jgi:hypothetical protein